MNLNAFIIAGVLSVTPVAAAAERVSVSANMCFTNSGSFTYYASNLGDTPRFGIHGSGATGVNNEILDVDIVFLNQLEATIVSANRFPGKWSIQVALPSADRDTLLENALARGRVGVVLSFEFDGVKASKFYGFGIRTHPDKC
jgi:hypothetical protein